MDNKDIYDKFNDIDFDISSFEEIPMDEVEKQRLKKSLKEKLSNVEDCKNHDKSMLKDINGENKKSIKKYKVVAVVAILAILIGITPLGQDVIAQIAEKLIFTPSHGIIRNQNGKELYMLEEPVRINIDDNSILIKSIINDGENLYIEIWFEEDAQDKGIDYQKELINNLKIKPIDENLKHVDSISIDVGSTSFGSGGYAGLNFEQGDSLITNFKLYYNDKEIDEFSLKKVNFKNGYDEIGGNAIDKEVLLGATSYYQEGERYFKIWSDKEYEQLEDYTLNLDTIGEVEARDEEGNVLSIENANDGTGRAFKILSDYKGKLHIKIKDVYLRYSLIEGAQVVIKIPKNGETNEINEELKLKGLEDKIKATTITNKAGEYTIHFDFSNNYDENRTIFMVRQDFRSGGTMGDVENEQGEVYLDNDDLTMKERLLQKIYMNIDDILIHQDGDWKFIVE
jgi:hypothetical protein